MKIKTFKKKLYSKMFANEIGSYYLKKKEKKKKKR